MWIGIYLSAVNLEMKLMFRWHAKNLCKSQMLLNEFRILFGLAKSLPSQS
jgi:hypothetical protein